MLRFYCLIIVAASLPVFPGFAEAFEITAQKTEAQSFGGPQFKDFANELAFAASPPIPGPTRISLPWRPWADLSMNIRAVRPAPGRSDGPVRRAEYAWTAGEAFSDAPDASVLMPILHAGIGLPHKAQLGLLYGRSPNVNLQVAGLELSYPFLSPSLTSPGLWARIAYAYPWGVPGVQIHLPTAGLYLTNEFLRTPVGENPFTAHLHAGLQQMVPIVKPLGLVQVRSDETDPRDTIAFPASTQFFLGFEFVYEKWSLKADTGYASSQTTIQGATRIRAFWNQAYRVSYHWNE